MDATDSSLASKPITLDTYPQYRRLALTIYGAVLLLSIFDWVIGSPPASFLPIGRTLQLCITFGSIVSLILFEAVSPHLNAIVLIRPLQRFSISLFLSCLAVLSGDYFYGQFLFLITILFAELAFSRRASLGTAAIVFSILFLRLAYGPRGDFISVRDMHSLLNFCIAVILIMWLGHLIKNEWSYRLNLQAVNGELRRSHDQLQKNSDRLAELAVVHERNRLARDIHDGLGHHLAAVSIQLSMAEKLFERSPEQSLSAIHEAKQATTAALQDVRKSVGTLRASEVSFELEPAIDLVIERMTSEDLAISYRTEGQERGWPRPVLMALYRAAQEGLTNIHKHASAAHVNIWLQFSANEARLRIVDDGIGFDRKRHTNGTGLRGLQERVAELDGSITIDSRPNEGTILDIRMPRIDL